jgi:hypothetical protein
MRSDDVAVAVAEDVMTVVNSGKGAGPRQLRELESRWKEAGANPQARRLAEYLLTAFSGHHLSQKAALEGLRTGLEISGRLNPATIEVKPQFNVEMNPLSDNYQAQQAGAMGPNATAHHNVFQQVWNQSSDSIDLAKLADELSELRKAMRGCAEEADHDEAIGAIASAEKAARQQDGATVMARLKEAGSWALDVAKDVGKAVAAEAIKAAILPPGS